MSILNPDLTYLHPTDNKENSYTHAPLKTAKNDTKPQPQFQGPIARLEDDEEDDRLMQAKRKMKFNSLQNYTFTLQSCSEQ